MKGKTDLLDALIMQAIAKHASDVHFQEQQQTMFRLGLELYPCGYVEFNRHSLITWLCQHEVLAENQDITSDVTFSFFMTASIRCRVHVFLTYHGWHAAVRLLYPMEQLEPDCDQSLLEQLSALTDGLILVCGPTGSGKTTTLWRIIENLNNTKRCHVITLEDPIEYVLQGHKALVSQRELGHHFYSYTEGVKQALRQDPDVLLIGEMRDQATMDAALTAAETGHLVLSTLHTRSAAQAITRFVGAFPAEKHSEVRARLAQVLQAVLSQRRYYNEKTYILREVLLHTTAVEQLIRTEKEYQLMTVMQTSASLGMKTMEQAMARSGVT